VRGLTSRSAIAPVALTLAALLLSACGRVNGESDGFVLSDEEVQRVVDAAGPSQETFLEDGEISPAERERAYLNFVECSLQQGVEVFDWSLNPHGGDSFNTRLISGDEPDEELVAPGDGAVEGTSSVESRAVDLCRGKHYTAVGVLYESLNRRTGSELQSFEGIIAECMRRLSFDVPNGADLSQISEIDRAAANSCFLEADG